MRLIVLLSIVLLSACSTQTAAPIASTPIPKEAIPTVDPTDTRMALAQDNYNSYCAHCHGYGGEGQPQDTAIRTRELGYSVVPAHDASGHTWEHPDQLLFEAIKYGIESPLHLYPMSAYGDRMSDDEIFAVVDYLKRWWTDEQQAWQAQLSEQFAENNTYWTPDREEP